MATPFQITVDCADSEVMCRFWSTALGYVEEPPPAGYLSWEDFLRANGITVPPPGSIGALVDPDGIGPRLLFLQVPEKKTVKNRVHLDIRTGGSNDHKTKKIKELTDAGAREVRRVEDHGSWWTVLTDPEGNEFCVT